MPEYQPLQAGDPRQIGAYQIVGRLGEGGQGVVYLAESESGELRAVKVLHARLLPDAATRERLSHEVEAARRLPSFCTAKIYAVGLDDPGRPYIVSEYLAAHSLHAIVEEHGPLAGGALDHLAVGTVTILAATHQAGIVHRDLKPHNVLLGPDGPRLVDFGIARALEAGAVATSGPVGTPAYMAPEQLREEDVGTAADMFSWAVTMTFAATGRPAFGGTQYRAIDRILHGEPDIAAVPEPLRDLVERCLDKRPNRRPSAREVLDALMAAVPEHNVEIITTDAPTPPHSITIEPNRSRTSGSPVSPAPAGAAASGPAASGWAASRSAASRSAASRSAGSGGSSASPTPASPRSPAGRSFRRLGTRGRLATIAAALVIVAGAAATTAIVMRPDRGTGRHPARPPVAAPAAASIVVGSANFPENVLLGEIYAQVLEDRGFTVVRKFNIGPREDIYPQLEAGAIDVLPEYNGSLASFIGATGIDGSGPTTTSAINRLLRQKLPSGLRILHSAAAEDKDSITVTRRTAAKYDLKKLADLEHAAPDMVMGGSPEFEPRHEGILGLRLRYHIDFKNYQQFFTNDLKALAQALRTDAVQAADLFTTDPSIRLNKFVVLQDPDHFFSAQNVTPLIYTAAVSDKAQAALNDVSGELTTDDLLEMNTRVANNEDPAAVAKDWLEQSAIIPGRPPASSPAP
ncbi:MAG TPA: glycine betaine ABC transporter substrate-binding protein [Streptosporangiaceae bacterium]